MKKLLFILLLFPLFSLCQTRFVEGHMTKNGNYIEPHWQEWVPAHPKNGEWIEGHWRRIPETVTPPPAINYNSTSIYEGQAEDLTQYDLELRRQAQLRREQGGNGTWTKRERRWAIGLSSLGVIVFLAPMLLLLE